MMDGSLNDIYYHLDRWRRWYRLRRAAAWGLHGFMLCLALALAAGLALLFGARLLPTEFYRLLVLSALAGMLAGGALGFAWSFPRAKAARFFDLRFGLKERISTALELAGGQTPSEVGQAAGSGKPASLAARQIEDAASTARQVDPRALLPLRLRPAEILVVLVLAALAPLSVRLAGEPIQAAQNQRAAEAAVEGEAERLEELISEIEADPVLTEEQRQALTAPLEEARQQLSETRSLEEALSALTEARDELQRLEDSEAQAQAQDLRAAGERLSQEMGSAEENPLQPFSEALSAGDFDAAAQALRELQLEKSTAEEAETQARQFEAAAEALEETQPALAEELRQAAQALLTGEAQTARQALDSAAQSVEETGQAGEAAQAASQASAQVQAGQERLAEAGGGSAQAGAQSGEGQGGQAGQGQANAGSGQSGEESQGAAGSGQGESSGEAQTGEEAGTNPIQSNNGPGDGGESAYDPVYAPQRLDGSSGQEIGLPGSALSKQSEETGGQPIGQGSQIPGEAGSSQVPYTEVYSNYAVDYYRAIESGQVPAGLRDVVRQYFSSLAPR
jgi:hypothetical protein